MKRAGADSPGRKASPKRKTENMSCVKPIIIYQNGRHIKVPCYYCVLCQNTRRLTWLFRIQQEQKYNVSKYQLFVTLTYNEKNLPKTFEERIPTLNKHDPRNFFKRLRKTCKSVKYILVGEYGTKTQRPHYHIILFTDANPECITKAWGKGNCHFRQLAKETVLYTLKYILNSYKGSDPKGRQKQYAVYSKGIGLGYLTEKMYDYHTKDYENPIFYARVDGEKVPLPRYYRNKMFTKYQQKIHAIKEGYRASKQKHDAYRYLKAKGFQGNKDKEIERRKLSKVRGIKNKHEKQNRNEKI